MNCTELDVAFDDANAFFTADEGGFVVAVSTLALLSCALLVKGEVLVRPMGALVAALLASGAVFVLSALAEDVPCMARVAVAATAGVLAAVLVLCLFKTGLFVLGAAGFGTVGHYVYQALPIDAAAPPSFTLLRRSGWYYLVVLGTAAVGAVASLWERAHFVRLSSALLGGGGVAWTVYLLAERTQQGDGEEEAAGSPPDGAARARDDGEAVPSLVLLLVMLVSAAIGVGVQTALQHRAARRQKAARDGRV